MNFKFIKIAIFIELLVCNQTVRAEVIDRLVAKVNGQIITLSEVMERARLFKMQAEQSNLNESFSEKEFQKRALDSILEEMLLLQEGNNLQMEVDDEKVKQAVKDIKKENNVNDEIFKEMLERDALTLEEYKKKIRNQILISQVRKYKMSGRVNVTERQLRKYYRAHLKEFMQSPKIHVRHILFLLDRTLNKEQKGKKQAKARDVHRQIKEGTDFIVLAKLYSEDESASVGGDLGILERGKMVKEFEEAAFQLLPGEVSPVVETPYGLHIIQVDKIIPSKTKPFDEVKAQISQMLFSQEGGKQYKEWIDELKKKAFIENFLFQLKKRPRSAIGQTARLSQKMTTQKEEDPTKQKKSQRLLKNVSKSQLSSAAQKNKVSQKSEWNLKGMEKRLQYLKILQKRQIITDQEYERRKEEVLNQY